jgi:hypothetical protein
MNIIFTVCNRESLANALALAKSVTRHTGSLFYLCWVDPTPLPELPRHIKVLDVSEIHIPQWDQMNSDYYDFELLRACRPWFAKHLVDRHQEADTFTFFAPTVLLYHPYEKISAINGGILLTPHTSGPLNKSALLDDKKILNVGMFHAGSWILHRTEESLQFLNWWASRTADRAKFDLCNGMCMDQLWLNFALIRIKDAFQIADSGWHFGLHAVLNRKLDNKNGQYFVDDSPLISADFAGLGEFDPIWSDHAALLYKNKRFQSLHRAYLKEVKDFEALKLALSPSPGYGRRPDIKSNRILRNKIAGKLRSITRFIDQF